MRLHASYAAKLLKLASSEIANAAPRALPGCERFRALLAHVHERRVQEQVSSQVQVACFATAHQISVLRKNSLATQGPCAHSGSSQVRLPGVSREFHRSASHRHRLFIPCVRTRARVPAHGGLQVLQLCFAVLVGLALLRREARSGKICGLICEAICKIPRARAKVYDIRPRGCPIGHVHTVHVQGHGCRPIRKDTLHTDQLKERINQVQHVGILAHHPCQVVGIPGRICSISVASTRASCGTSAVVFAYSTEKGV